MSATATVLVAGVVAAARRHVARRLLSFFEQALNAASTSTAIVGAPSA
jgi:hypothetical protein